VYYLKSTPYSLTSQIAEWQPINLLDIAFSDATIVFVLFSTLALVYVASLVIGGVNNNAMFKYEKKNKVVFSFLFLVSIVFFTGTLIQGRFIDYWVPFAVIFIALYFEFVYANFVKSDKLKKITEKIKFPKIFSKEDAKMTLVCFIFIILGLSIYNKISFVSHMSSHESNREIKEAALWMKNNTLEKSIVFNVNWGDFSRLFFYNSDNYYILGLDPQFLYLKSPEKYWLYAHIGDGIVCGEEECQDNEDKRRVSDVMKKEFNADYVYVPTAYMGFDYTNLINVMEADSEFEKVFQNDGGQIWKLK